MAVYPNKVCFTTNGHEKHLKERGIDPDIHVLGDVTIKECNAPLQVHGNVFAKTLKLKHDFKPEKFINIGNTTIYCNEFNCDDITVSGTINIHAKKVISTELKANNFNVFGSTLDLEGDLKLTGNFGFNTDVLTDNYFNASTITFKSGIEYFVNNQIDITNTIMLSSIAGVKSKLTLGQSINQLRVVNVTATDIDSSNGRRVNNFYGSATNCDNWRIWNDNTLPQVSSTF